MFLNILLRIEKTFAKFNTCNFSKMAYLWHMGAAVSTVTSLQEGSFFKPASGGRSV